MDGIELRGAIRRHAAGRVVAMLGDLPPLVRWLAKRDRSGHPLPAISKRRILLSAAKRAGISTIVETGTFFGDTTYVFAKRGFMVKSVEVEPRLAALARRRFQGFDNVEILVGDSGQKMPSIIASLGGARTLFWLDGHFSGGPTGRGESDTPIEKEIDAILLNAAPGSLVYVDDARCFGTLPGYPTLFELNTRLSRHGVSEVHNDGDIIVFSVPQRKPSE